MKRFRLLALVAISILPFNASTRAAETVNRQKDPRPNVIVIIVDDLGYADLGVQGATDIKTPNIDSLAKSGVRFTNGYVTGPYCSPTRAGLISGRYQERTGHDFNPSAYDEGKEIGLSLEESTIADAFKGAGYRTAAIGKWHLGVEKKFRPTNRGFDEFYGFLPAVHPYVDTAPGGANPKIPGQAPGKMLKGEDEIVEAKGYTTDLFGAESVAFIERNKEKPFFLYLATNAVHTPLQATDKYLARFPNAEGKRKPYLAMLSALDDAVGTILKTLRDGGIEDNTLIYFISDNGGPEQANGSNNGKLNGGKATVWEGGIRVPFFVQWKAKLPQGVDIATPVAQIDIFPTSIAAAGIPNPPKKNFDGRNILPLATGQSKEAVHDKLYWRFGKQWAIREGEWKLARVPGDEQPKLFNLKNDEGEQNDVADEYPEIVKKLTEAWDDWNSKNIDPRWIPQKMQNAEGELAERPSRRNAKAQQQ